MSTIYNPKSKVTECKFGKIARTDSSTDLMSLPKDAIITGIYFIVSANCDGTTGSYNVGYSGNSTGIVNGFNLSTNDVGYHPVGGKAGTVITAGDKLTSDIKVLGTFSAGDSSSGGNGFVKIEYIVPGSGESLTS